MRALLARWRAVPQRRQFLVMSVVLLVGVIVALAFAVADAGTPAIIGTVIATAGGIRMLRLTSEPSSSDWSVLSRRLGTPGWVLAATGILLFAAVDSGTPFVIAGILFGTGIVWMVAAFFVALAI